jgi:hypothetical protein
LSSANDRKLVKFAHDLGLRVDVFKMEANPAERIEELVAKGEKALNIVIPDQPEVAERAQGSFQIAQLLCSKLFVLDHVTETQDVRLTIRTSLNVAVENVMSDLGRQFMRGSVGQVMEKGWLEALLKDPDKVEILSPYWRRSGTSTASTGSASARRCPAILRHSRSIRIPTAYAMPTGSRVVDATISAALSATVQAHGIF